MSALAKNGSVEAAAARLSFCVERMVHRASADLVAKFSQLDDESAVAALIVAELQQSKLPADARSRMAVEGARRFNQLVEVSGGTYLARDMAVRLRTTDAAVAQMLKRRQLFGFKRDGQWMLPTAQIDQRTDRPVNHLQDVLRAFPEKYSPEGVTLFMLAPYERMNKSPIELLKDGFDFEILVRAAARIRLHGAQ